MPVRHRSLRDMASAEPQEPDEKRDHRGSESEDGKLGKRGCLTADLCFQTRRQKRMPVGPAPKKYKTSAVTKGPDPRLEAERPPQICLTLLLRVVYMRPKYSSFARPDFDFGLGRFAVKSPRVTGGTDRAAKKDMLMWG